MRIRSIKPEFWTSEDIAALDWPARLLFIGLWSYVDDNGVGRDVDQLIKAALFPLEEDPRDTLATVSRGLQTLSARGHITRYEARGKRYLHINAWGSHQKIDRPAKARYPLPTSEDAEIRDTLATVSRHPREGASTGTGEQGNRGTESSSSEVAGATPDPERLDVERICTHLAQRVEANTGNPPNITKRWRDAARLMLDRDGRTEAKVHACIDWCQDDEFWRTNILSMPKLREKYDQLSLKARQRVKPADRPTPIPPRFIPPTPPGARPDSAGKARDALRQARDGAA